MTIDLRAKSGVQYLAKCYAAPAGSYLSNLEDQIQGLPKPGPDSTPALKCWIQPYDEYSPDDDVGKMCL